MKTEIKNDAFGDYVLFVPGCQFNCVAIDASYEMYSQILTDDEEDLQKWMDDNKQFNIVCISRRQMYKNGKFEDMTLLEHVNFLEESYDAFDEVSQEHIDAVLQM